MKTENFIGINKWLNEFVEEDKKIFELDDILYDISIKIFDYRLNNDLKQKDLAEKLGVSQAMISKLESGEYNPTIEQLWKISNKLNFEFSIKFNEKKCIDNLIENWGTKIGSKNSQNKNDELEVSAA